MKNRDTSLKISPLATRRDFLKNSRDFLSHTGLLGSFPKGSTLGARKLGTSPRKVQQTTVLSPGKNSQVVHSVCLGCNARCGNRSLVKNGKLLHYSGNPFHPYNHHGMPTPYGTPVQETLGLASPVCGKALDGPNYVYNPYRLIKPLKRSGPRGSGKFRPIDWKEMITEIAEGGNIFAELGEEQEVDGLGHLQNDENIDQEAPELGPKRNGFIFMSGRMQSGRKEFIDRFVKGAMGSCNRIGHTDICGLGFRMGNLALSEKKEVELKADPWGAEYILVFGANIYEALQPGINTYGAAVAKRHAQGKVKFTVIDPRAQNSSTHATDWLAIKPGQDGALAQGIIRRMLERHSYDKAYLRAPNPKAAQRLGHGCYTNATHLVITEPGHAQDRKFLRMADMGGAAGKEEGAAYMVLNGDGSPLPFDTVPKALLDEECLLTLASGQRVKVKTSFRLMKEGVMAHSLAEYSQFCGISKAQIIKTADQFASHGKKAAVCQYHGAGNYPNGTYAAYAVAMLSCLVGSVELKGGYLSSGGAAASASQGIYDLKGFSGKLSPKGVKISRENADYQKSSEFRRKKMAGGTGYPAKRPWFSFTKGGLSVESLSGIDAKYPYSCKVLFTYFYNPLYSTPGGYRFKETLQGHDKVPLHVSIDTCINESNLYADYIIPDVTYAEGHYGWLTPHAPALKFTGIRSPCIQPLTGSTQDDRPFCLETFLIDLAEHMGLPGFGNEAILDTGGMAYPLHRAEDFYLRGFANIAHGAKVPPASGSEVEYVEANYPVARFKGILSPSQWRQTCYILARGGVFHTYPEVFSGDQFESGLRRIVLYNEELATTINSLSGDFFQGSLSYQPPRDAAGQVVAEQDSAYPFALITHKMNLHSQSRTTSHRYTMEIFPENYVVMHFLDAQDLEFKDLDMVRISSRSNTTGISGKVKTTSLIRRGCVSISAHYGHSQLGASALPVTGADTVFLGGKGIGNEEGLFGDPKRGTGINPNLVSRLDEHLGYTPLLDLTGGIPDFSTTRVTITRES